MTRLEDIFPRWFIEDVEAYDKGPAAFFELQERREASRLIHSTGEQFAYFRFRALRQNGRGHLCSGPRCLICDFAWDELSARR